MDLARVIVVSTTAGGDAEAASTELVDKARARNESLGLTGFSTFDGTNLLQVLEGGASDVMIAMAIMQEDLASKEMRVLAESAAQRQIFPTALGYGDARTFKATPIDLGRLTSTEALLMMRHMAQDEHRLVAA